MEPRFKTEASSFFTTKSARRLCEHCEMAETMEGCQIEHDCLSDSDLPSGLPSPDASDDEEIRNCTDSGITTPYFFNKLREMTKPLFHVRQDLSPGVSADHAPDRPKSHRSKKRTGKDNGSENTTGIIERHYGYIPNPRWPKAMLGTRYFNPKGLGKEDEAGIPGLVFRDKAHQKNHSYQETDFPELNSTSKDDSSFMTGIHNQNDSSMALQKRVSFGTPRDTRSPLTSTPLRHEGVASLDRSSFGKSPAPGGSLEESRIDDSNQEQTAQPKNESKGKSGRNNNRRRSKRLSLSPSVGRSSNPKEPSQSDVSSINSSTSFLTACGEQSREGARAELTSIGENSSLKDNTSTEICRDASLQGKNRSLDSIFNASCSVGEKNGLAKNNNNNRVTSPSWSQVASRSSSPVPVNNSAEVASLRSVPSPLTVDTRPASPSWSQAIKASPAPSPGLDQVKCTKDVRLMNDGARRTSSPVPSGTQRLRPPSEAAQNNSRRKSGPKIVNNLGEAAPPHQVPDSVWANNKNRPSSPLCQPSEPTNSHLLGKNGVKGEVKHHSFTDALKSKENVKKTAERQRGTGKWGDKQQRAKLLTLDNFMTPKKVGKNHWPNHGTQDVNAFENRFVEHIEVSATSPPKKVRPSPIKKLNFSLQDDKNSSSESDTTKGEGVIVPSDVKAAIFKRQVSLIKDLDGQKVESAKGKSQASDRGKTPSRQIARTSDIKFCLEDYVKKKEPMPKDILSDDEDDVVNSDANVSKEVEEFWKPKPLETPPKSQALKAHVKPEEGTIQQQRDCEEDDIYRYFPKASTRQRNSVIESGDCAKGNCADPAKVTFKAQLKKYARRYCHMVEEHTVFSIAEEIQFILQLLTPYQLDQETLNVVDVKIGGTAFRSVHNSVYFAVLIIKKLRRLFLCLPYPAVHLLAHNTRIKAFSPKLHACFLTALSSRVLEPEMPAPLEYNPFKTLENGVESFPDTNFAHVFKCQRDNFYALYRQYHDQNAVHPFIMEEQIQYVYDCKTPEQNSITNLMHLAELYLEHLIQCCLTRAHEVRREILFVGSDGGDGSNFERMLMNFLNSSSMTSGGLSSIASPKGDKFFIDFIQTLRCPAFNEHLKNLLISKILELNGKSFDCMRNLHSSVMIGDDKTPSRCHEFGMAVLSLCGMARVLGHLVFLPYTSGAQDLPVRQEANLRKMREMVPLPLPLPLLLQQAFEDGHLTLTLPWVCGFLSMMDQAAPRLSVFHGLLERLKYLQRYAWKTLYEKGHHNSGLLVVLSVSKLFQTVAGHLSPVCDETGCEPVTEPKGHKHIDAQRLVSSALLFTCCPHLVHSCMPLAAFAMEQNSVRLSRKIIPLAPTGDSVAQTTMAQTGKEGDDNMRRRLLGSAVLSGKADRDSLCQPNRNGFAKTPDLLKGITVPVTTTQSFTKQDVRLQNDLKTNFVDGTAYLRSVVDTSVNLLCGKVEEYALSTILKMAAFEAKREVRSKFLNTEKGDDAETVKSRVLIHANVLAYKFSSEVRHAFFQAGEIACQKDLLQLVKFLTSCLDVKSTQIVVHVAQELMVHRLKEWAAVQLGPDFFRRLIIREAERCGRSGSKPVTVLPNDFSQKPEESEVNVDLQNGFEELLQLSEMMDKALSGGVWYINALTPGTRPGPEFMLTLLRDLIGCVDRRLVTIDFAFYVMANFLMHLIVQYIVDAPANWSHDCLEAFVKLCLLCEDRKDEDDRLSVRLAESVRKSKNVKVKVFNLVSVFSLQWIAKSAVLDHSLMVYCQTLARLVGAGLMTVDGLVRRLVKARGNPHTTPLTRGVVDRTLLRVLTLLYASSGRRSEEEEEKIATTTCDPTTILSLVPSLRARFQEWGCDKLLRDLNVAFDGAVGS